MTAQLPDLLVVRGKEFDLCATPLEPYLRRIRKASRPRFMATSTACWRGYVARWEVKDGRLYLVDLECCIERDGECVEASLSDAFPGWQAPVFAFWVTDELRCPEGALVRYRHHGFGSRYERDRLFYVTRGEVQGEVLRLNPPEPIWYRIEANGSRTRVEAPSKDAPPMEDLFAPEEMPRGYRYWGQVPVEDDDAEGGYLIAAAAPIGPRIRGG